MGQTAFVISASSSLFRKAPWLLYDLGRVDRVEVSRLLRITVADMSDPFASAIRQQYPVLVAGWFGSSMDVVVVSSVRTLASLVVQASRIVNRAIQQELSVVVGEGRFELVAKISRHLLQYSLIASGLISIPLFLGTDFIFRVWTAGEVRPDYVLVGLMLASTCIHSIVLAGGTVLRSANLHARFAIEFLVSVVAGFAAALTLVGFLGVHGIALSAVLSDLMLLGFVSWSLRAVIPRLGLRRQS